ncbi:MAG: hypothetical protein OHK0046_12600 [Anaerolineae bacterium]
MRNIWSISVMVVLALLLAACGSSNEAEPLPTVVVLPTLAEGATEPEGEPAETENVPSETVPTEEPTTAPTSAGPTQVPTKEPTQGAPPFAGNLQPPGDNPSISTPQQNVSGQNNPLSGGSSPFGLPTTWVVDSDTPVNIYECIEEGCAILMSVSGGTQVLMIEEGEEWHNVQIEDITGFIPAEAVIPAADAQPTTQSNPNFPPGFPPAQMTPGAQSTQGGVTFPPTGGSFPPGVVPGTAQPGGPGGGAPFPPSNPGS